MKPYWFVYIIVFVASFFLFRNPLEIYQGNIANILLDFFAVADIFETPMLTAVWWYMCFAQILILFLPFLVSLVEKIGVFSIPLIYVFLRLFGIEFSSTHGGMYTNYLYAVILAILCIKYHIFEKLSAKRSVPGSIVEAVLLLVFFYAAAYYKIQLSNTPLAGISTLFTGVSALLFCVFIMKYTNAVLVSKLLAFLGKHSGNIFMIHELIMAYYANITYASRRILPSFLTLLMISLLCSVIIEMLKKAIRYDSLINWVSNKLYKTN